MRESGCSGDGQLNLLNLEADCCQKSEQVVAWKINETPRERERERLIYFLGYPLTDGVTLVYATKEKIKTLRVELLALWRS